MQVSCEHCGAEYELESNSITGRGARITCPTCSHVFIVYQTPQVTEPAEAGTGFEIDLDELDLDMDEILGSMDQTPTEVSPDESKSVVDDEVDLDIDIDIDIDLDIDLDVELDDDSSIAEERVEPSEVVEPVVALDDVQEVSVETDNSTGDTEISDAAIAALNVHELNFASVGIKSWRVKRTFGLMFEYSDFKTFKKSLSDGRITGDDSISPDGEEWVLLNSIEDYEYYFCKTYLEFEKKDIQPVAKKVKEKVVQPLGGMNELASALALAQAEVEEAQSPAKKQNNRRTASKPKSKPRSAPPVETKSGNSTLLSVVGLLVFLGGGWFIFGQKETPPEVPATTQQTKVAKPESTEAEKEALLEEMRAELRKNTAKIEEEREVEAPEPSDEEPQLMVKVPEEILAQQRALQEGQPVQPVATKPKVNHLDDGLKALNAKQWAKAVTSYQAAAKQSNSPEVQSGLGYALYRTGKESEGQRILKLASQQGAVSANKWLGYILKEHGDEAGANQYFQKYLQSNPKDATIIQMEMNR